MQRRDAFLRQLVAGMWQGPAVVAQNLRDQAATEKGPEDAIPPALRSLGFEVSPIGGNGKPDGLAKAILGVRSDATDALGKRSDYSFTYDAKSSGHSAIKAEKVRASALARHRDDYHADHALVVAPGFEGGDHHMSALGKECVKEGITPITVKDLAMLVQVAAVRRLTFMDMLELFETARIPAESHAWIVAKLEAPLETPPPVQQVLEAIAALQEQSDDPVEVAAVVTQLRLTQDLQLTIPRMKDLIGSLQTLAPRYVTLRGSIVTLATSVNKVIAEIARHHRQIPDEILRRSHLLPLLRDRDVP